MFGRIKAFLRRGRSTQATEEFERGIGLGKVLSEPFRLYFEFAEFELERFPADEHAALLAAYVYGYCDVVCQSAGLKAGGDGTLNAALHVFKRLFGDDKAVQLIDLLPEVQTACPELMRRGADLARRMQTAFSDRKGRERTFSYMASWLATTASIVQLASRS